MTPTLTQCFCCSGKPFVSCCQPFIEGKESLPSTALQLMRSRYSAYCMANVDYIQQTMRGEAAAGFDKDNAKQWAENIIWCGLNILDPGIQQSDLEKDAVEFAAKYIIGNQFNILQERSEFEKTNGKWFYVFGKTTLHKPKKIKSTDLCPCGSRKKFAKCCARYK